MQLNFIFFFNSILLGVGLAMDAFSVSLADGLHEPTMKPRKMSIIAGMFALFQALMPLTGWFFVHTILQYFQVFEKFIPWIALGLLGYIAWSFYSSRKAEKVALEGQNKEVLAEENKQIYSFVVSTIFVVVGLGALVIGANLFVNSAVYIAKICNISDAVIGLTIVAVGTSLPELATSLVAAIKHEEDIAIGNVIGSNIFNILGILGIAPLVSPIKTTNISWVDMSVMIALAVILYPMMKTRHTISRVEGGILLVIYIGYVFWLFCQG